tara:strand:+ start:78 stop:719 length:642 start_codon:yes stop_codon:yes gene_type:complete
MAKEKGYGLASLVPLNARTFIRNIMREEGDTSSLLTAEDFTPEQIELIYKQVDEGRVVDKERGIIQADSYGDRVEELEAAGIEKSGRANPSFIDQFKLSFSDSPAGTAYNLGTTLGGYTAIKNSDGTVTIRDTYNWTGQKDDPEGEVNITFSDFLRILPKIIKDPEGAGNVAMRSMFKGKKSPVEFTLPPRRREKAPTEMPEGYRAGGRTRLI